MTVSSLGLSLSLSLSLDWQLIGKTEFTRDHENIAAKGCNFLFILRNYGRHYHEMRRAGGRSVIRSGLAWKSCAVFSDVKIAWKAKYELLWSKIMKVFGYKTLLVNCFMGCNIEWSNWNAQNVPRYEFECTLNFFMELYHIVNYLCLKLLIICGKFLTRRKLK